MARNDDLLKGVAIGLGVVRAVLAVIAALAPVVRPHGLFGVEGRYPGLRAGPGKG